MHVDSETCSTFEAVARGKQKFDIKNWLAGLRVRPPQLSCQVLQMIQIRVGWLPVGQSHGCWQAEGGGGRFIQLLFKANTANEEVIMMMIMIKSERDRAAAVDRDDGMVNIELVERQRPPFWRRW